MKYALPLLVVLCSPAVGSELTPEQLRGIQEFGAAGIDFSTTRREFLNRYPGAVQAPVKAPGCTAYLIGDASGTASGIGVGFLDDQLAILFLMYFPDKVNHYGVHALEASVSDMFGRESVAIGAKRLRDFPQIDRRVLTGRHDDGEWFLCIMCSSVGDKFVARVGGTGFGF
jgi:hypothetical protein